MPPIRPVRRTRPRAGPRKVLRTRLAAQGKSWRERVEAVATDDPTGLESAADEELPQTRAATAPFHAVALAAGKADQCRHAATGSSRQPQDPRPDGRPAPPDPAHTSRSADQQPTQAHRTNDPDSGKHPTQQLTRPSRQAIPHEPEDTTTPTTTPTSPTQDVLTHLDHPHPPTTPPKPTTDTWSTHAPPPWDSTTSPSTPPTTPTTPVKRPGFRSVVRRSRARSSWGGCRTLRLPRGCGSRELRAGGRGSTSGPSPWWRFRPPRWTPRSCAGSGSVRP